MKAALSSFCLCILLKSEPLAVTHAVTSPSFASELPKAIISNQDARRVPSSPPGTEEQHRHETSWEGQLRVCFPGGQALVASAAAAGGAFVYLRDERQDLFLRTGLEIANNLNQLIGYGKGGRKLVHPRILMMKSEHNSDCLSSCARRLAAVGS